MTNALFTSKRDNWETPTGLFKPLDDYFHFTLDPCCTHENAKCTEHYTIMEDGLKQSWGGHKVFMNPPFGREVTKWVRKAYEESQNPNTLIVGITPARTDTLYWHNYNAKAQAIIFLKGRVKYCQNGKPLGTSTFPTAITIWNYAWKDKPLKILFNDMTNPLEGL